MLYCRSPFLQSETCNQPTRKEANWRAQTLEQDLAVGGKAAVAKHIEPLSLPPTSGMVPETDTFPYIRNNSGPPRLGSRKELIGKSVPNHCSDSEHLRRLERQTAA